MSSYYEILEINDDATSDVIRQSYKKLVLKHHPDKGGDIKTFQKIQEAYECLSDDNTRAQYDNTRAQYDYLQFEDANEFMNMHSIDMSDIFNNIINGFGLASQNFSKYMEEELNIYITVHLTLMDIYVKSDRSINYQRSIITNNGKPASLKENTCWKLCKECKGIGTKTYLIGPGYFQKTICEACDATGFNFINGCKIENVNYSLEYTIPYGIHDGYTYIMKKNGHVGFNKYNKKFQTGDVFLIFKYDINKTNEILKDTYNFPNIYISAVHSCNIDYTYEANIFEFITGTEFNLALPNGEIIVIIAKNLNSSGQIKGKGLPNTNCSSTAFGNVNIYFGHRRIGEDIHLPEFDKIALKRMMRNYYPKVINGSIIELTKKN